MYSEKPKPTINKITLNQLSVSGIDLGQIMQDVLAKDMPIRFKATGNSMHPFIRDGDLLIITPKFQIKPKIGKVVAFINPGNQSLLIHRIIAKKSTSFLIKGDNSVQKTDGWIHKDQVLGCVTGIERNNQKIRFGLGIERFVLAFLSKHDLLKRLIQRFKIL